LSLFRNHLPRFFWVWLLPTSLLYAQTSDPGRRFQEQWEQAEHFRAEALAGTDPQAAAKAVSCWEEALGTDPLRLDLYLSLADFYRDEGDFEGQYQTLAHALKRADREGRHLQWKDGLKPPGPPSRILSRALAEAVSYYSNPPDPEKMERLSRLFVTFYPSRAEGWILLAGSYRARSDWPHALKYLLVAGQKDPGSVRILRETGSLLKDMGKGREAAIYYRKADFPAVGDGPKNAEP
jgi:tetratricopeptide (TPR) repeat protein